MGVKALINRYPRISREQIIKKIEKYSAVSFDVFDTLLKRDVARPEDVFQLVEIKYNKNHDSQISDFKNMRVRAEKAAREKKMRKEVTLREIYNEFDENADELMAMEIAAETEVSRVNPFIKDIYDYCVKTGKRIYIISDTYLDGGLIKELLRKNGVTEYRGLYVSSEYGVMKRYGELFRLVLEKEGLSPGELVHIGDSKRSDFLVPRRMGIRSVSIPRDVNNAGYLSADGENFNRDTLYAFINNRLPYCGTRNIAVGYEVYGPLLYGFAKWLTLKLDAGKTTLFFARDCHVVKRAFEKISKAERQSVYFLASRKSLIAPILYKDSSLEQVERLMVSEPPEFTLEGFLKKFGLAPEKYLSYAEKYRLRPETILKRNRLRENGDFVNFWRDIEPLVKLDAKRSYDNFFAYFDSLDLSDGIQAVDIGWRGTMQYCLKRLLPDKYTLRGRYIGVREDTLLDRAEYDGLYLDGENDEDKKVFLASVSALIEIFFSAPHGSVKGYDDNGSPVYEKWECGEDEKSQRLVRELQEGAMKFVDDFSDSPVSENIVLGPDVIFDGLKRMGKSPKKDELKSFGDYPFSMGIGTVKAAAPDRLTKYLFDPKKAMYDFSNSNWKIAFMMRLFKVRLPYYSIFKLIYEHKG